MSAYIDAVDLPFTLHVTDASIDEAAQLVTKWQESGARCVFHLADAARFVVQFGRLTAVAISAQDVRDSGERTDDLKPIVEFQMHGGVSAG